MSQAIAGARHGRAVLALWALLATGGTGCDGGGGGGNDGATAGAADSGEADLGGDVAPPPDSATDAGPARDTGAPPEADATEAGSPDGPRDAGADVPPAPDGDVAGFCVTDEDCRGPGCRYCSWEGRCVPCACRSNAHCDEGQVCDVEEGACVAHCRVVGCPAGEVCNRESGLCRPLGGCDPLLAPCPEGQACFEGACVAPDANDTCASPTPLLSGVPVQGTTRRHLHQYAGSCSHRPSPDAVFSFDLAEDSGVRLTVAGEGHFDPLVFVRSACDEADGEVGCSDVPFLFGEVFEADLPAGTYYAFVESFGPEAAGDFTLTLDVAAPGFCQNDPYEPNDDPGAATDVHILREGAPLRLCPGDADHFALDLFPGDTLRVEATAAAAADGPNMAILDPSGRVLVAGSSLAAGTTVATLRAVERGGTFLVRVGPAAEGDRGDYRLAYEVFTERGTPDCTNPTSLAPGVEVQGSTAGGASAHRGSCSSVTSPRAPEVVYKFRLDAPAHVTLTPRVNWDADLYLRSNCLLADTEIACADQGPIVVPNLPAGTYYVFVDGHGADAAGPFGLLLTLGEAVEVPANDTCAAARELRPGEVVASTTEYAANDYDASCTVRMAHQAPTWSSPSAWPRQRG